MEVYIPTFVEQAVIGIRVPSVDSKRYDDFYVDG